MLSQNTLKSYHKTQIDRERLAPAVSKHVNKCFEFVNPDDEKTKKMLKK